MNNFCAPVGAMSTPFDQTFFFQTVDGGSYGATGQKDLFPDFVDGERPLLQQGFENSEVAAAHFELRDAVLPVRLDRPRRLPQHEENVNPATARQRFQFIRCLHIYLDIKILYFERSVKRSRFS